MIRDWDHLRIFLAIARWGNLSSAAQHLGISQPTVTRALQALEQSLGTSLAVRGARGLTLTPAGVELQRHAFEMEQRALRIGEPHPQQVRISAGGWMSRFLSRHADQLIMPQVRLTLLNDYAAADLHRAEAEIALRNQLPKTGYYRVRKLASPAYALYGQSEKFSVQSDPGDCPWISFSDDQSHHATAKWLHRNHPHITPRLRCNQAINMLDALKAGIGIGILPRFVGDHEPDLSRLSANLDLDHQGLWLLVHQDMRQHRTIKTMIAHLLRLFECQSAALCPAA
ncbi:LysR family transcriptional regulator [Maritalea mediterranea]|uniref:LysR family transcriptional regulator n=1 Tax=Maritalea mediterranea TaxID=2909667 RepID=A0ABS9E9H7_9HYPH|nr:LysR family transcriptional regulator [Maritalea mediterranea]MCF4099535.1 LysR family transcriptional regulator [Maritalea mediterranea]